MKLPTSIENILNENIVENARLELKKNWNPEPILHTKNMIARKYRNRRIGEFLKELKLTEGRNTGVPKIKRALKNNGSKEPEFETNDTRDYFITTIFMHEGFENEIKDRPRTD